MAYKPNILAHFKRGQAIGAVDNFTDTMNWLVGFVGNLKTDTGIEIQNQNSDHPTIKAKIIAGNGIKVEESGGAWKISSTSSGDDDEGGYKKKGSGGSGGSGSSGRGGSGGSNGGDYGGGSSGGGGTSSSGNSSSSGGTGGTGGGSGKGNKGTDCNQLSDDLDNNNSDIGMSNAGDNCAELNGW